MWKTLKDKFNAIGLHRLNDRQLETVAKWSRRFAMLAAGGVAIWAGVGAVGLACMGLKAAGVAVPALLSYSTIALSGIMVAKHFVGAALCRYFSKRCDAILQSRRPPAAAPAARKPSRLGALRHPGSLFNRAVEKKRKPEAAKKPASGFNPSPVR